MAGNEQARGTRSAAIEARLARIESSIQAILGKVTILDSVKVELSSLTAAVSFLSEEYDKQKTEIASLSAKVVSLTKSSEELSRAQDESSKIIAELNYKLAEAENVQKQDCVVLKGIQEMNGENVNEIATKVVCHLITDFKKEEIVKVTRLQASDKKRGSDSLLVQLKSVRVRDAVISECRRGRITTKVLGANVEAARPIFANEYLSSYSNRILEKAVAFKKTRNFKFVWVKNGKIFLRKAEGEKIKWIKSELDLR